MVSSKPAIEAFQRSKDRKKLESATNRIVSMCVHHTPEIQINSQSQSPLWHLPPELLTNIYKLALAELPDDDKKYPPRAPYIRPGYHALPKQSLGLLSTCRRIWLETCMLPPRLATFTWWFGTGARWGTFNGDRNCLEHEAERMRAFFNNLTPLNRTDVSHVRLFTDMRFLKLLSAKSELDSFFGDGQLYTNTLTISIRDIDWGLWRTEDPQLLDVKWLVQLFRAHQLGHVATFKLEMECGTNDYDQTLTVARRLAEVNGKNFERATDIEKIPVTEWSRDSKKSGLPRKDFFVFTATWTNKSLLSRKMMEKRLLPEFPPSHQFTHNRKRRGGRRYQAPANEAARVQLYKNEKQRLEWESDNLAHEAMATWENKGSLLTLVPKFVPMAVAEKEKQGKKFARKGFGGVPKIIE